MSSLVVESLDVRYGAVSAVRGLSLEVHAGEIVGLIGPNGAGKSSTLHAIMGAAPIVGGDVRLGDRSLVGLRPEDVARSGVALVPEGRRIFAELTVAENLTLGLAGRRSRTRQRRPRSSGCNELFPIVQRVPCSTRRCALGRTAAATRDRPRARRRARRAAARRALARARPRIVDSVFETLDSIRADGGVAVLLVEQRAQRTIALADRTYVIANGEHRLTLGPQDAADTDRLVPAYLA